MNTMPLHMVVEKAFQCITMAEIMPSNVSYGCKARLIDAHSGHMRVHQTCFQCKFTKNVFSVKSTWPSYGLEELDVKI